MTNKLTIPYADPQSLGIQQSAIDQLLFSLQDKNLKMHSLLIMKDNQLIYENYWKPYTKEKLHRMFSVSKTYTALAVGILFDEGLLSPEDRISKFFPEYITAETHEYILDMTIKDLLMMRTCHRNNTYDKFNPQSDWVGSFFTTAPSHPSGLMFAYDTAGLHVLCALVEKLSGMDIMDFLREKFDLLDLSEQSYFIKDGHGVSMGGTGLMAPPMDLLKIGYLIANNGNVNGVQLLSSSYIKEATSFLTDTRGMMMSSFERCGYGMQFWMHEEGGFCSYGMAGQLILFYPYLNMVIVTTADGIGQAGSVQLIQDSINRDFIRKLRKTAPSEAKAVQDSDIHTLSFPLNGQQISINFRLDGFAEGKIPFYDMDYTATGTVWGEDKAGRHLYIRLDIVDESIGSIHFDVVLLSKEKATALSHGKSDKGLFVSMNKYEETMFGEFTGQHLFLESNWKLDI